MQDMTKSKRFRIEPGPPRFQRDWATVEWLYWNQEVNDILKRDVNAALFKAAYDAVGWESYYERLRGTPFYEWAVEGGGILSFGGPAHIAENRFFSTIGDMSMLEGDWLREHPEFNQVLHDIHVETVEQMVNYILQHAPQETPGPRIGDSVVVKEGTTDPDLGTDLGGWQGRVLGLHEGEGGTILVRIQWDSITLKNMSPSLIEARKEQGLAWTKTYLDSEKVEQAVPRDTEADAFKTALALSFRQA